MVIGDDQDDGQADQQYEGRELLNLTRLLGAGDVLEALEEAPGSRDVDHSPLDDLASAQPDPRALGPTLCRRVVHSAAPMSRAVYANPASPSADSVKFEAVAGARRAGNLGN